MLVINWLSSHEDPSLQKMAVAVSCLLVSKVKTARCLSLHLWDVPFCCQDYAVMYPQTDDFNLREKGEYSEKQRFL